MRIKEEIKRSGTFWLPSSPERQVAGTLSISDGADVKLELPQSLYADIRAQVSYTHPESLNPILGHVETDGYVMIDRCYRLDRKRSIVHGRLIAPDVVWANRILTNLPYSEMESLRFKTLTFSVEGIDNWVGISGIEVDTHSEKSDLTISYDKPADISFNLKDDMQLLITFDWTPPELSNPKRAEVSQKALFKLISQNARELDKFTSIAQKITAFLCFVMNEIVCLDRMRATADSHRQETADGRPVEIYYSSWPYAKDEPEINEVDMLFRFKKIQTHAESIINKWIDNYEQIAPALDLYFLTKTGTLPSWNMQFLTLVQALEAYHRRTSDEKHMDPAEFEEIRKTLVNKCRKKERSWFAQKLNYANELTLRNRFERMTEPFGNFMCGEKRPLLIDRIVKTRNYLTHYDSDLESETAKGDVLRYLCIKMNVLFRLHFLKLIGFNEQEINAVVNECPFFKGVCNL